MKKVFAQKMVFFGWIGIILTLLLIPKTKPSDFVDSPIFLNAPKIQYCMNSEGIRHDVIEYLNEQDIKYTESESIRCLMTKAMKIGYSPSDEMYTKEDGIYIPSDDEIKQTKDTLVSGYIIN